MTDDTEGKEVSWPITIRLTVPIEFGKETIEELTFRRGRLADIKGIELGNKISTDSLILVASRMCGRTTAELAKIDQDDVGEVLAIAGGFIRRSLVMLGSY
jgi:hypothetical protein